MCLCVCAAAAIMYVHMRVYVYMCLCVCVCCSASFVYLDNALESSLLPLCRIVLGRGCCQNCRGVHRGEEEKGAGQCAEHDTRQPRSRRRSLLAQLVCLFITFLFAVRPFAVRVRCHRLPFASRCLPSRFLIMMLYPLPAASCTAPALSCPLPGILAVSSASVPCLAFA